MDSTSAVFGGTTELLGLIERIYGAVHDPSLWPDILARITTVLKGESLGFFTFFPDSDIPGTIATHAIREDAWTQFVQYYSSINPIMVRAEPLLEAGHVVYAHRLLPGHTLERTEFYNDFFAPNDMHFSVGIRLRLGDVAVANLSCQRSKVRQQFEDDAALIYRTLAPHLQNALFLQHQLHRLNTRAEALETGIDAFGHAIFGLDAAGRVVLSTRSAEAIASAGDILRISNGVLSCSDPRSHDLLQALSRQAITVSLDPSLPRRRTVLLHDQSGKHSLQLIVTPFRTSAPGFYSLAALIFVSDPDAASPKRGATLRELFGLTPTETRVAELLAGGEPIRAVAETMKITLETARFHTKRVLNKTGVQRQADLVRLILSIPGE